MSRVKEFRAFLCMGRYKSLGILKSFLWYASQLSGMRCVFTSWASPGWGGSGCSLMAARLQVFLPSWVPSGLTSSPSMVAAIADDCDILCLLMWQEIFHFSVFTPTSWPEILKTIVISWGWQRQGHLLCWCLVFIPGFWSSSGMGQEMWQSVFCYPWQAPSITVVCVVNKLPKAP